METGSEKVSSEAIVAYAEPSPEISYKAPRICKLMNRKGWVIGIAIAVLVLPIIPTSFQVPYSEPIEVQVMVPYSETVLKETAITIGAGEYMDWESGYKSGSSLSIQLEADSPVVVAVLDQAQFSVFEDQGEISQNLFYQESDEIDASIPILETGSYSIIIINQIEGDQAVLISSIEISENWEQEETQIQYTNGTRTMTDLISILDLILGPPVY